jgi:hypothetical protein
VDIFRIRVGVVESERASFQCGQIYRVLHRRKFHEALAIFDVGRRRAVGGYHSFVDHGHAEVVGDEEQCRLDHVLRMVDMIVRGPFYRFYKV